MCFLFREDILSRPNLCSIVLLALCAILSVPVVGLTIFHIVLVSRGRTTNEQVTGKFQSGYNPFTVGCVGNIRRTLCGSQFPSFTKYEESGGKRTSRKNRSAVEDAKVNGALKKGDTEEVDETTVLYVPDKDGVKDGHIRLKQLRLADSQSVGTSISLTGPEPATQRERDGSTCNLFESAQGKLLCYCQIMIFMQCGTHQYPIFCYFITALHCYFVNVLSSLVIF
ncbi:hypothetical protein ANCDUO_18670 [Ancylostoma duodenale]|uniref:Palmitoyltransferase n=1 Tax=Ancylostoma duodenale TaxID=51022 RepID=A0A0C2FRN8_9BILA|nr:hypothetical protein ANCDUO_18670 [Ancylostoma duodenale]